MDAKEEKVRLRLDSFFSQIFRFAPDLPVCSKSHCISKFQRSTVNNFAKWQLGRRPQQHDYPKVSNNNSTKQPQPQPQVCSYVPILI